MRLHYRLFRAQNRSGSKLHFLLSINSEVYYYNYYRSLKQGVVVLSRLWTARQMKPVESLLPDIFLLDKPKPDYKHLFTLSWTLTRITVANNFLNVTPRRRIPQVVDEFSVTFCVSPGNKETCRGPKTLEDFCFFSPFEGVLVPVGSSYVSCCFLILSLHLLTLTFHVIIWASAHNSNRVNQNDHGFSCGLYWLKWVLRCLIDPRIPTFTCDTLKRRIVWQINLCVWINKLKCYTGIKVLLG